MSYPRRRVPAWALWSLVGLVVCSLLAAGGYLLYPQLRPSKDVTNYAVPGAEKVLKVTGKKVPRSIKARTVSDTLPLNVNDKSKAIISQGNVLDVTPNGRLGAPMQMRFRLTHKVTSGTYAYVAYHEKAGDTWQYQQATVTTDKAGTSYGTVTMPHLTRFWPFSIDFNKLIQDAQQQMLDDLTGDLTQHPERPTCPDTAKALQDNYQFVKIEKQAIYACIGMEKAKDGKTKRVVEITSHMRYALELDHTDLFTVESAGAIQAEFAQIARVGSGPARSMLFPGDTVKLSTDLPLGKNAMATTKYSGWAAMFNRLDIIVDTLTTLATKLGVAQVVKGTMKEQTLKRWETIAKLMDKSKCRDAFADKNVGKMIVECFGKDTLENLFGAATGLLLWPITLGGELLNWLTAEFQSFVNMFTKNDEAGVNVVRADPRAAFVGDYQMYRNDYKVKADGTIEELDPYGVCNAEAPHVDGTPDEYCTEHYIYRYTVASPTRLRVTLTDYYLVNGTTGKRYTDSSVADFKKKAIGQHYDYDLIHPGVIDRTADDSDFQSPNPVSCNKKVADKKYWDSLCHVNG